MKAQIRPIAAFTAACTLFCLPLAGQTSHSADRIAAPIDEAHLIALPGNIHPLAQARFDRGPAPVSTPTGRILLILQRSAAQQQALTQYLADVQNPSAAVYHKWLTPAEYGVQFGISDDDLQSVQSWLQGHGFRIEKVPQARNVIEFSGSFGQIQSAFHTAIHTFAVNGENHFANLSDPQIPAALAPVIAGVGPLNDFHPRANYALGPSGHYNAATHTLEPDLTLQTPSGALVLFVDPADAATIYDTPNKNLNANYASGRTYDGSGVNIGIAGDSDVNQTDVGNYRAAFLNQTATTNIPSVVVDGNDPGYNGDEIEALLDNEVAGGVAPGANLYFYTSANSDLAAGLFNAIFRALDDNTVSILNISFGSCEAAQGSTNNQIILESAEQAAALGISVTVSTGDSGSAGCDNENTETAAASGFGVNAFASTPYTIAVGGTDYDVLATSFGSYVNDTTSGAAPYFETALRYIPEEPWNDSTSVNGLLSANSPLTLSNGNTDIVAGGGGQSSLYSKPPFQSAAASAFTNRDLPDVSFLAGNGLYNATWVVCGDNFADGESATTTAYDCITSGGQLTANTSFLGVGGTSASAPAFAGMLALVSQSQGGARLGQADSVLYQLAASKYSAVFHDVTTGNNSVVCASGSPHCGSNGFLSGYNAGTNYDLASGLGSVDVSALITNWNSVHLASTSTSFNINGSTAAYSGMHGAALTLNVGVNPAAATGVVGIIDTADETTGGPQLNGQIAIPLTSGAGSVSYNGLPGGKYTVSARYGGDVSDAASTSSPIGVDISAEPSTTTLTVNAYNPLTDASIPAANIPYGSIVAADAQITGTAEGASTRGVATGTVTFLNGSTALGTAAVSSGNQASWPPLSTPYTVLAPGSYTMTASYPGDASYEKSVSSPVTFSIVRAATVTTATASPTTIDVQTFTTISVTITSPLNLGAAPTGTFTVTVNGNVDSPIGNLTEGVVGTGPKAYFQLTGSVLVGGQQLAPGSNTVTVQYAGDANYAASSTTLSVYNTSGIGTFTLSNSGNVTLTAGQSTTVTITATPAGGFTGPVTLNCGLVSGVMCNPNIQPNITGTAPGTGTVTIATVFGTTAGTYAEVITGVDDTGKTTATTTVMVTVNAIPSNAGFTLSGASQLTVTAGDTTSNYVNLTFTPTNGYIGMAFVKCTVTTSISSPTSPPTCSDPFGTITANNSTAQALLVIASTTASTSPGTYTLTVTATDSNNSAITATATITLTVNAPVQESIALSNSGNISVNAGATSGNTSTITVTPGGGFTGQVNLSCAVTTSITNPNAPPTCGVPASTIISGAAAATATLTVNTTAPTTSAMQRPLGRFFLGGGATLALLFFFGIPAHRRAWRAMTALLFAAFVAGTLGCGSSGGSGGGGGGGHTIPGTTAGNYTVTVTGVDAATGQLTSGTAVTLTVN